MSRPKRSLGVIGIAVIAILNGWHLVPVQTFAWATMAIGDASQGRTFTETLTAAIDGESKCQICHYVEEQNCGSGDISLLDTLPKLLILSPNWANFTFSPPSVWTSTIYQPNRIGFRADIVETPPPISEGQSKASLAS